MPVSGMIPGRMQKRSLALTIEKCLPLLKYAALCLMIVAMARPQWGIRRMDVKTEGINIILAVDISESMAALDFKKNGTVINRLEAVKGVVADFVSKRNGDRIGMVVFGTHAYTQVPLTRDYSTIITILDRLKIGSAGKSTAIGDAVGISLKRVGDVKSKSNIIILLTDGRSNTGELSPDVAADIAEKMNVRIYTIGVGSKGKVPFLVQSPIWGDRYVYQQVDIDEQTLKDMADKTGGAYFRARDLSSLEEIYNTIDQLEKTTVEVKTYAEYNDLYVYLLSACFVLTAAWIIMVNTRFLRVP